MVGTVSLGVSVRVVGLGTAVAMDLCLSGPCLHAQERSAVVLTENGPERSPAAPADFVTSGSVEVGGKAIENKFFETGHRVYVNGQALKGLHDRTAQFILENQKGQ